jgi:AAA15 family ATPase/GTPase
MTIAEFTVENFCSFKGRHTFSLLATAEKEFVEENTFHVTGKQRFLRSAVLYGANASGKSNFFKALSFFRDFAVFSGPRKQIGDGIGVNAFYFSKQTENEPSSFEIIVFISKNEDKLVRYRYGFSVTHEKVIAEYLFAINNTKEVLLFSRIEQEINTTEHFREGLRIKDSVRTNCTLLSICAQNNGEISSKIVFSFMQLLITSGLQNITSKTRNKLSQNFKKEDVINFLKYADTGITDLDTGQKLFEKINSADKPKKIFYFAHAMFDNVKPVGEVFIEESQESSGTQKLFSYSIPILEALESGKSLFIDEFDAQLHPLILENIVKLFNSPVTNPKNAQLVISCHAINILTNKIFRRDQIWFCEKDEYGATDLYSLAEYKEPVRNDASYNKDYLSGKYGAVPYINAINLQLGQKDNGTR